MASTPLPHVVIIGGGFGGLYAARSLKKAPVRITLIDRRNFHLFQPLLYQVATGQLSPGNIASPLRFILKRQSNTSVLLAEAIDVDAGRNVVKLSDGEIAYDTLIMAAGSGNNYFGHDAWAQSAPGLKSLEDATYVLTDFDRLLIDFFLRSRANSDVERHNNRVGRNCQDNIGCVNIPCTSMNKADLNFIALNFFNRIF